MVRLAKISKMLGVSSIIFSMSVTALYAQMLEEVIVTAQKREESLQDVPIAMQAFTGDQLSNLGIAKASDVTKLAPNMNISMQNPANKAINIRGIGTSDFFGAAPGSVGVYMDEVTMSSPYLTAVGIYDMERVEVLRGPQNSLFGRNTTGGAINYISRMPEVGGERDGYLRATYGRFDRIDVEAASSFQLSDTMAVRVAGKTYDRDGIWNNMDAGGADYGEKDRKSVRATLVWEPTDITKVTANIHWAREESEIDPYRHVGTRLGTGAFVGPVAFTPTTQVDFDGPAFNSVNGQGIDPSFPDWENVNRTGSNKHEMDTYGFFLKIEHDFDWATATSITAYDDSETLFSIDAGGSGNNTVTPASIFAGDNSPEPNLLIDQDQQFEQFSQEIRLASPSDQRFRWIAGFYYFSEDAELSQNIRFGASTILSHPGAAPPGAPIPNPGSPVNPIPPGPPSVLGGSLALWSVSQGLGVGFPGAGFDDITPFSIATYDTEVLSPYVRAEYDITDNLTLTLGYRYTSDDKTMPSYFVGVLDTTALAPTTFLSNSLVRSTSAAQVASGLASTTCTSNGRLCATDFARRDLEADEWGGRVGLDWRPTDDLLIYGHYSRGFRSGKYDIEFLHGPQTGFPLQDAIPETLDAYEIGLKSNLMDGSLQFNVSAFFYQWFDKQTFFVNPVTGPAFSNVPESESLGIEVEAKWAPAEDWFFSAGIGFLDTEVTEESPLASDEAGHELQHAAPFSFNGVAVKDFRIGNGLLSLQLDYQYRDESKSSLATVAFIEDLESASLLGARATYTFGPEQQYEVAAFGENILASKYCEFKFNLDAINGVTYCIPNEGQAFWGLQAGMKF